MKELARQIGIWRLGQGFHTPGDLKTIAKRDAMLGKLMLVVSEVAEAAEAVRRKDVSNFKEELADAVIRILDIADACEIDLEHEVELKMAINYRRPKRHGKLTSL